jgi:hypothetical protein
MKSYCFSANGQLSVPIRFFPSLQFRKNVLRIKIRDDGPLVCLEKSRLNPHKDFTGSPEIIGAGCATSLYLIGDFYFKGIR